MISFAGINQNILARMGKGEYISRENKVVTIQEDTVIQELLQLNPDTLTALYILVFKTYEGFENI